MILDCKDAAAFGLGKGWVVYDTRNGGIVAHDERDDDTGFVWMMAAHKLADALGDIERTIYATHPQQFAKEGK